MSSTGNLHASILFTDLVGSSKMTDRELKDFKNNIEVRVIDLIFNFLSTYESFESEGKNPVNPDAGPIFQYNSWGDAYMFVFKSAEYALECAKLLTVNFRNFSVIQDKGVQYSLRASLHYGQIIRVNGENKLIGKKTTEFTGRNIIISARIEPITPKGRIWVTEEFKSQYLYEKEQDHNEYFVNVGVREFSKRWGAAELYEYNEHPSQVDTSGISQELANKFTGRKFLSVRLSRKNGVWSVNIKDDKDLVGSVTLDEWILRRNALEDFIASDDDREIETCVSIGVQHFLYNERTKNCYVGVRTKKTEQDEHLKIACGTFDAGYQGISTTNGSLEEATDRWDNFIDQPQHHAMFKVKHAAEPQPKKVPKDSDVGQLISRRGGKNSIIFEAGGKNLAVAFVNPSRNVPRMEIGICMFNSIPDDFMDIEEAPYSNDQTQSSDNQHSRRSVPARKTIIENFGVDKYGDQNEEERGNFWIWCSDGVIFARSIYSTEFIPKAKARAELAQHQYHNCLVRNSRKEYGFVERFVSVVSDEALDALDDEVMKTKMFSFTARSVLQIF